MGFLQRLKQIVSCAARQWWNDRAPRLGAALAYYGAFSIAPAVALIAAIGGIWFGEEATRGELAKQLNSFLGEQGSRAVQAMLASAHVTSQYWYSTALSVLLLLFGSFGFLSELQDALDTIWNTPPRVYKSYWGWILDKLKLYVVLLVVLALFIALVLANTLVNWAIQYIPTWSVAALLQVVHQVLSWLAATVLFAIVYRVLPNLRLTWQQVWLGAAITALLFLLGRVLIAHYLTVAAVATTHGAAGAFAALLIWLYYSAQVFLFGAELTHAQAQTEAAC